jgi:hypothetical protein
MKDKLISKKHFPIIVGLTALAIALCAASFSVYGISLLFGGAAISVALMAGTLEFGKLIATTYLYRYWHKMGGVLRWYLISAVVVLMVITSLGIFGFLSSAYQKSSLEYNLVQSKIQTVEAQKAYHSETISNANVRIQILNQIRATQEARLNDAQTNAFLTRNPLQLTQLQNQTTEMIGQANTEVKEKNTTIDTERQAIQNLDKQIMELKIGVAGKKDIQTFKYVADQLKWKLDDVAFWFMLAIIFVFDPFAISLILAYNVAAFQRESLEVPVVDKSVEVTEIPVTKEILYDSPPKKV